MGTYISAILRRKVYERAGDCCEYCLIPETAVLAAHEIDHIIAQKHGGLTEADNLALSCAICNKHKGSDLASLDPVTGEIVALYHPRRQQWQEHFQLKDGLLIPLTPTGRVTVKLLQLNNSYRIQERNLLIQSGIFPEPGK